MWLKSSMDESSWMIILVLTMANYVVSQTVTCGTAVDNQQLKCQFISANNIEWYKNGIRLTECAPSLCIPNTVGDQTFTASGGEYEIVIGAFNDSFCDLYSCRDTVTLASDSFPNCPDPTTSSTTITTGPPSSSTTITTGRPTSSTTNAPGPNLPVIIGIVVGIVGFIAVVIFVIVCLRRKTNKEKSEKSTSSEMKETSDRPTSFD